VGAGEAGGDGGEAEVGEEEEEENILGNEKLVRKNWYLFVSPREFCSQSTIQRGGCDKVISIKFIMKSLTFVSAEGEMQDEADWGWKRMLASLSQDFAELPPNGLASTVSQPRI
jgi:hypothetical protein